MPSGADYERLVAELVAGLVKGAPALAGFVPRSGAGNRMKGASGYAHQIDLSLSSESELYVFGLKCLQKSIGVAEVLVLAARLADISAAPQSKTIHSSIISLKRPSRNVPGLAAHFNIQLDIVEDTHSFGVSFASQHFIGYVERTRVTDYMDAEVVRGSERRLLR